MTTRSQKRKAVDELVSGDFEASVAENNSSENLVAGPRKTPIVEPEKLEEIKTSSRKEIMSDLTKILAENQKEMLKLLAPLNKKHPICLNVQDSDSEPETISVARTSTLVKAYTATSLKQHRTIVVTGRVNLEVDSAKSGTGESSICFSEQFFVDFHFVFARRKTVAMLCPR